MGCAQQYVIAQDAAVATGNGTPIECVNVEEYFDTLTLQVTGITSATITWEASTDGTNYVGVLVAPVTTGTAALTTTANGIFRVTVTGYKYFRARISTWVSGATTVSGYLTRA